MDIELGYNYLICSVDLIFPSKKKKKSIWHLIYEIINFYMDESVDKTKYFHWVEVSRFFDKSWIIKTGW